VQHQAPQPRIVVARMAPDLPEMSSRTLAPVAEPVVGAKREPAPEPLLQQAALVVTLAAVLESAGDLRARRPVEPQLELAVEVRTRQVETRKRDRDRRVVPVLVLLPVQVSASASASASVMLLQQCSNHLWLSLPEEQEGRVAALLSPAMQQHLRPLGVPAEVGSLLQNPAPRGAVQQKVFARLMVADLLELVAVQALAVAHPPHGLPRAVQQVAPQPVQPAAAAEVQARTLEPVAPGDSRALDAAPEPEPLESTPETLDASG
jgi:hypothetical protein